MKTTILDFSYLLSDLDSPIDDSFDKWLHDLSVEHDKDKNNEVDEHDYALYLEEQL